MSKILVVGGAGYIGSHMVQELIIQGYEVVVFDNLSTGNGWAVPQGHLVRGDLVNTIDLSLLFSRHKFDAVCHFASMIQVGESVQYPLQYYSNNVSRTINLLNVMKTFGVTNLIFSSTAAVYGTPKSIPISEESSLNPENPYGHSKRMVEQILKDCHTAWGLNSVVLRYFNAAGAHPTGHLGEAHTPETHLIPTILEYALGKRSQLIINGADFDTPDGTCIRDYVHVCDLAHAHMLSLEHLLKGGGPRTFNLGNGSGYSNQKVLEMCMTVTGKLLPAIIGPHRVGDPDRLIASYRSIKEEFGWYPKHNLESIVQTAWNWHRGKK